MSFSMGAMRLLLGCVASLFAVTSAHSATRRLQAWALPLYLEQLTLTNNQIVEYKTSATTGGADPILYLLRASGTSWVQVAVNDNYTALEARVQHQNTTGSTQNYLLVLRTKNTSFGTTTLIRDGGSGQSGIAVGGQVVAASSLLFNSSDQIRTRHVPGRSVAHAIFALTTSDGLTIGKLAYMNAPGDAANISSIGTGVSSFLVGTPNLKTATTYDTPRSGAVDLYANDIGSDIDGDGVGDALETFLGLCKQAATCQFNYLPTDSDRDGLTDGEELWGVAGTRPDGADDVPFGRWGADPTRKDAFVEVDYAFDAAGPMTPGVNPFQYMRTNPGSWSWTLQPPTATVESWADAVRAPYLAAPGSHIKNLGTTPPAGLQIHLDLGVPPLNSDDEAKFGDYGSKGPAQNKLALFVGV